MLCYVIASVYIREPWWAPCFSIGHHRNSNQNTTFFVKEIAFEDVVNKILAILFRLHCVYTLRPRRNFRHFADDIFNTFSWMKMHEFRLRFHWSLFLRFWFTIFQHWFRYWLGAGQMTSHYLKQWWLVYWRIYASLGLSELIRERITHSWPETTDTRFCAVAVICSMKVSLKSNIVPKSC